jgi:hypothetical protein
MKRIIYTRPDGGIDVIVPAPAFVARFASEDEAMEALRAKRVPAGALDAAIVETVPDDRAFRDAWELDQASVAVNMPKARAIHMDRIRRARDTELQALDVETMKAVGKGDDTERDRVETEKQKLRDIPRDFDLEGYETPEALKQAWPAELADKANGRSAGNGR